MKSIIASGHKAIAPEREARLKSSLGLVPFVSKLRFVVEEVRLDYARMRMPYNKDLVQPAGLVHGGAIMSLADTVVVPAILSGIEQAPQALLTIDSHTHFLGAVKDEDCIAEAEIRHRGRKIVFLAVEIHTPSGVHVADTSLAYKLVFPRN